MMAAAKRVLAVEDDKDILELYAYIFNEAGYEVCTSSTGKNLAEQIREFHPALVVLDVDLGELNGGDLCRQIKADPENNGIIVLLVSANTRIKELMLHSGADGFLAKPFDLEELLLCTASYLAA
jgi:DNA-binding response OmpR family regulator